MIDIRIHGTKSEALSEHVNARLTAALDQHGHQVTSVEVKLEDLNGKSKGNDKRCHITVKFPRHDPVIVDEVDDDMYTSISRGADRVKNAVGRLHDKLVAKHHGK